MGESIDEGKYSKIMKAVRNEGLNQDSMKSL